jgi:hypothetical protein
MCLTLFKMRTVAAILAAITVLFVCFLWSTPTAIEETPATSIKTAEKPEAITYKGTELTP